MCRFVAYIGQKPIILNDLLGKPENSLINQSHAAKQGTFTVNADGFGIGWYNHDIDDKPGTFKSVRPAWNDQNLQHIAAKLRANCFAGHVRAATAGDVNTFNCHPFVQDKYMFVHNGTIFGFDKIKRKLLRKLSDERFARIQGHTDSEFFFSTIMDILAAKSATDKIDVGIMLEAFKEAATIIKELQSDLPEEYFSKINSVLTDGRQVLVTRYTSDIKEQALSLYYAKGDAIDTEQGSNLIHTSGDKAEAILIASEPVNDYADKWQEIPTNHALLIGKDMNMQLRELPQ